MPEECGIAAQDSRALAPHSVPGDGKTTQVARLISDEDVGGASYIRRLRR